MNTPGMNTSDMNSSDMNSSDTGTSEAINAIEGFLLLEAERSAACARARMFSSGLPWLTDSQREEVERHYADDRLTVSKAYLERVAARSAELRAEYEAVYRMLRRRLVAAFVVCAALMAAVATVVGAGPAGT
ncbi:hypothetical protein [Streptomyces sp. NPDC047108]|uniref:hypothetical protein n=1 Tax=Streptomyces sp. NPDC047108 TaxID=3155025 RepID=UPI0033EE3343